MSAAELYLDLLIRTLTNLIYEDPNMDPWSAQAFSPAKRAVGQDWPRVAHTMVGVSRLENVVNLVIQAVHEGVDGNLIETGVWRGGCCILMQGALTVLGETHRKVFVADSFEGLPKPDAAKYTADAGDQHHTFEQLAVSLEEVRANFAKYNLLADNVVFVKGFFEDTLPTLDTGPLAVLRLDGDMYGSTMVALEHLYPKLSPGGYLIVDDYGAVPGCRRAVDDYRRAMGIEATVNQIDWSGIWWQKPRNAAPAA